MIRLMEALGYRCLGYVRQDFQILTRVLPGSDEMKMSVPGSRSNMPGRTGSNLPGLVENLASNDPEGFQDWVHHAKTALPDLRTVRTGEKPGEPGRYLSIQGSRRQHPPRTMWQYCGRFGSESPVFRKNS